MCAHLHRADWDWMAKTPPHLPADIAPLHQEEDTLEACEERRHPENWAHERADKASHSLDHTRWRCRVLCETKNEWRV